MKYLIILFNITLIIFSIQIPVSASIEVHGEVSFKYDLEGQGELWTIDLNNEVKEDWILGTKLITSTDGYGTCFNIIPAFIPTSQLYEVYITYKVTDQLSGNNAILRLIEKTCGLYSFVDSAVSADGYGHFLSMYDGEENKVSINDEWFYIYRQN